MSIFKKLSLILIILLITAVTIIGSINFIAIIKINGNDTENIINSFKDSLSEKIEQEISFKDYQIIKYPFPKVILTEVKIGSGIVGDNVELSIGLNSILERKLKISNVHINNLYINPSKLGKKFSNYNSFVEELIRTDIGIDSFNVNNIWDTFINNKIIAKNAFLNRSQNNSYSLNLDLRDKIKFTENTLLANNNFNTEISIGNQDFTLKLTKTLTNDQQLDGEFNINVKNLSKFSDHFSHYFNFYLESKIKSESPISIKGKIHNNENGYTELYDITFQNDFINAAALYQFTPENKPNLLSINFAKLDLNKLMDGPNKSIQDKLAFYDIKKNPIRIYINSDEVNYLGDKIHNFIFDSISDGEKLDIKKCTGELASGGVLNLSGHLESNKYRPKFIGKIDINHPNLNTILNGTEFEYLKTNSETPFFFKSNIIATPIDFRLDKFSMSIQGQHVTGDTDVKLIGGENILIGNINFEDITVKNSNIPGIHNLYIYLKSLFHNTYNREEYNSKFIALRTFPIKSTLTLNFDGIKFPYLDIDRLNLTASYESGKLIIEDYLLETKSTNLKGNGRILAKTIKPQFRINFTGGDLNLENLSKEKLQEVINFLSQNIDLKAIDFISDGFINNVQLSNTILKNLSWSANDESGALSIKKSNFGIFDGSGKLSANILLNPFKYSVAYGIDSFKIDTLLKTIKLEDIALKSGFASINGQYTSTGNGINTLLRNGLVKGNFIAKNIKIENVDVNKLILNLSEENLNDQLIEFAMNNAFKDQTILNNTKGQYSINNGIFQMSNILMSSDYSTGSAGLAINIYDKNMDLKSIFSFYPLGVRIFNPEITPPVKFEILAKGNFTKPDKRIQFSSQNDLSQLKSLQKLPRYNNDE